MANGNPSIAIEEPSDDWVISVENVIYIPDYRLQLTFNDHKVVDVDFSDFLQNAIHPAIRQYLDIDRFKQFTLEHGELYWHDYALCFPIADLYNGNI